MITQARKSFRGNLDSTRPSILEQFKITTEPRSSDLIASRDVSKTRGNTHNSLIVSQAPLKSTSFKKVQQMKRDTSPATSVVTSLAQDYYKQMQSTLMCENSNLKDHNTYLVSQIKVLFEREKKYKKALLLSRQKIGKLENLNDHLNKQLQVLTNSIVAQIQRMQKLIELDLSHIEDDIRASGKSEVPQSLEGIGWQTQSTLNHNLQELKQRVHSICRANLTQPQTNLHYLQGKVNAEKPKRQSRRESNISGETFVMNSIQQSLSREEQFKNYLPINSVIEMEGRSVKAGFKKH